MTNQIEDIKIIDEQNRFVVSMPYLIHAETEADFVAKLLQNSINCVLRAWNLKSFKDDSRGHPLKSSKIQHLKGVFPYFLYSIKYAVFRLGQ